MSAKENVPCLMPNSLPNNNEKGEGRWEEVKRKNTAAEAGEAPPTFSDESENRHGGWLRHASIA